MTGSHGFTRRGLRRVKSLYELSLTLVTVFPLFQESQNSTEIEHEFLQRGWRWLDWSTYIGTGNWIFYCFSFLRLDVYTFHPTGWHCSVAYSATRQAKVRTVWRHEYIGGRGNLDVGRHTLSTQSIEKLFAFHNLATMLNYVEVVFDWLSWALNLP